MTITPKNVNYLRDWFAGQALTTMKFSPWSDNPLYWEGVARSAYVAADAMLAERSKISTLITRATLTEGEEDDDSYPPRCSNPGGHTWVENEDETHHGEGRMYCEHCGADGDA